MKARQMLWLFGSLLLIGGVAIVVVGRLDRSDLLRSDSETTKRAVLARIPIGTEVSRAKTILEADGLNCERIHAPFPEDRAEAGDPTRRTPSNILWCDSGERMTAALLMSKRWQVNLLDEDGRVARVAVGVGLTGP